MNTVALLDEIRTIARNGLNYCRDPFDRERYERLLAMAAREYAALADVDEHLLRDRFLAELGHVTPKVGADGAVFDEAGRILLVQRADDRSWGLVAGWVEPHESPEQTVVRELAEEIGAAGRVERLVGAFHRHAGLHGPHAVVSIVYLCSIAPGPFTLQPHEVLDAAYRDIDDVTAWHTTHERFARAARDSWLQSR